MQPGEFDDLKIIWKMTSTKPLAGSPPMLTFKHNSQNIRNQSILHLCFRREETQQAPGFKKEESSSQRACKNLNRKRERKREKRIGSG